MSQFAEYGRIGGLTKAARYSPQDLTKAATSGFLARFLRRVDEEEPGLPEPERQRRAALLRRAHMQRLAMKSAAARRKGAAA